MGKTKKKKMKSSSSETAPALVSDSTTTQASKSPRNVVVRSSNGSRFTTRSPRIRTVQNFALLWLTTSIDESDANFKHSLTQLQQIVNTIDVFTDADQCVDFLTEIKDEKVFMIVADAFGRQLIPVIHETPQLNSIYIFCGDTGKHEVCLNEWTKVKGIFIQIELICNLLKQDTRQCDHDMISISILSSSDYSKRDLNELEPSLMYWQILKEILLNIEYSEHAKEELIQLCREQYHNNECQLRIIDEFKQEYHLHSPIWWYTRECFTYSMLNRAPRTMDTDAIIKMSFFLCDIHQQIEQIHVEQSSSRVLMTAYRGQRILNSEFEKIRSSKGGLLSFNNFLSTSTNPQV